LKSNDTTGNWRTLKKIEGKQDEDWRAEKRAEQGKLTVRAATLTTRKLMAILIPISVILVVRLAIQAGSIDTNAPEVNPYKMEKTTRPAEERPKAIQAKVKIPVKKQCGRSTVMGP
jgi:hypothetical protein